MTLSPNKRVNLSRPTFSVVMCSGSTHSLCAGRQAETMYTPHNSFDAPRDRAFPTPQPHQDEAAELARADRSPAAAFVAIAAALAAFGLLWLSRSLLLPTTCVAAFAVVVSLLAWRQAHLRRRPVGVAVAALALGLVALAIVAALWA